MSDRDPDTHGDGSLVEGDPETSEAEERARRADARQGDDPVEERSRIRSGSGPGEGPNDAPASGPTQRG